MKKALAFLLTVILVLGCTAISVSAAKSPTANGVVSDITATDKGSKPVDFQLIRIEGKVLSEFAEGLKELKEDTGKTNLKIVDQYKIVSGDAEYPITVELGVLGVKSDSTVYILVTDDKGNVEKIEATAKDSKITFTLDKKYAKLAIVVDTKTATEVENLNKTESPKTGDATQVLALVTFLSVISAAYAFKKIKA